MGLREKPFCGLMCLQSRSYPLKKVCAGEGSRNARGIVSEEAARPAASEGAGPAGLTDLGYAYSKSMITTKVKSARNSMKARPRNVKIRIVSVAPGFRETPRQAPCRARL
jgi:NAD(P)-dependent dehydrogenase (short-subunit alcohol dehydrogenase family)